MWITVSAVLSGTNVFLPQVNLSVSVMTGVLGEIPPLLPVLLRLKGIRVLVSVNGFGSVTKEES